MAAAAMADRYDTPLIFRCGRYDALMPCRIIDMPRMARRYCCYATLFHTVRISHEEWPPYCYMHAYDTPCRQRAPRVCHYYLLDAT